MGGQYKGHYLVQQLLTVLKISQRGPNSPVSGATVFCECELGESAVHWLKGGPSVLHPGQHVIVEVGPAHCYHLIQDQCRDIQLEVESNHMKGEDEVRGRGRGRGRGGEGEGEMERERGRGRGREWRGRGREWRGRGREWRGRGRDGKLLVPCMSSLSS